MTTHKQTIKGNNNFATIVEMFNANVSNLSSILAGVIKDIASLVNCEEVNANDTVAYDIEDKITHNNVRSFKPIIDEYGQYGTKIDNLYDEYDGNQPGFKKSVFRYFKNKYILKLEMLSSNDPEQDKMDIVRSHSDTILRDIYTEFKDDLKASKNLTISIEEIDTCALAVICHAFIQCKLLEKPPRC